MVYITHKNKEILRLIKKYNKEEEIKILDVGAGEKPLEKFLPENIKYSSLDIDPKRNPDIVANLEKKLPIKDRSYDFVIASEVLEHTIYPKKIVKELKRITKNGGFIIISMPNEYNLYLRLKFFLGIQNNTEIPFREDLYRNHIHKARVKDLLKFYKEEFNVNEIVYSWDSFSDRKFLQKIDRIIYHFLMPVSKNLFSRSVIMIGKND
ncbi:MAG: class I SAM-dependent methyltransferase [Candidatus Pacearchaeota archaeon]